MLTEEMNAASTAKVSAVLDGAYPPPIKESPPTAVKPVDTIDQNQTLQSF